MQVLMCRKSGKNKLNGLKISKLQKRKEELIGEGNREKWYRDGETKKRKVNLRGERIVPISPLGLV